MSKYKVVIPKPVQKQLKNIPKDVYWRVLKKLELLEENPRPHGATSE